MPLYTGATKHDLLTKKRFLSVLKMFHDKVYCNNAICENTQGGSARNFYFYRHKNDQSVKFESETLQWHKQETFFIIRALFNVKITIFMS